MWIFGIVTKELGWGDPAVATQSLGHPSDTPQPQPGGSEEETEHFWGDSPCLGFSSPSSDVPMATGVPEQPHSFILQLPGHLWVLCGPGGDVGAAGRSLR